MPQIIKLDPAPDAIIEDINKKSPKKYVRVISDNFLTYDANKQRALPEIKPLIVCYTDGRQFEIDAVSKPEPGASLKSGGAGMRYACRIKNTLYYLYLEDNTWFIERIGQST